MTKEQKEKIISMRKDGCGYAVVAKALGMPKSTISSFCQKYVRSLISGSEELIMPSTEPEAKEEPITNPVRKRGRAEHVLRVSVSYAKNPNRAALVEALNILTYAR